METTCKFHSTYVQVYIYIYKTKNKMAIWSNCRSAYHYHKNTGLRYWWSFVYQFEFNQFNNYFSNMNFLLLCKGYQINRKTDKFVKRLLLSNDYPCILILVADLIRFKQWWSTIPSISTKQSPPTLNHWK